MLVPTPLATKGTALAGKKNVLGFTVFDFHALLDAAKPWAEAIPEVVPPENKDRPFEVHQLLLVRNGVYNLENLDLEELARDQVYEFAFVFAPLRLKGATGSPRNPIAVR